MTVAHVQTYSNGMLMRMVSTSFPPSNSNGSIEMSLSGLNLRIIKNYYTASFVTESFQRSAFSKQVKDEKPVQAERNGQDS